MAITGVLRPGHISLRVLELEPALKHYKDVLGLIEVERDAQGRVFLKAWDEHDHHSIVLREADNAGMDYLGWKVDSVETLHKLAADLEACGLCSDLGWVEAGEHPKTGKRFRFTVPTGHVMELFAEKEQIGNNCGTDGPDVNPNPWPDGLVGISPSRFDHCLLYGDDLDGSVKVFTEVLGFYITEKVVLKGQPEFMIGTFLTCANKAHDVAFIRQPVKGKLHHVSFELGSWEKVLHAGDVLSRTHTSIDIGPTRHGITRGETIYFFDPSGNRNEVFSGGYIAYPDKPVITWYDETLGPAIFYHDRKLNEAFLSVFT